jgi:adenosylcobinamide-phosphate synthase
MPAWTSVIALLVAFCVDRWIGEPSPRWQPLRWMRGYLGRSRGTTAWWSAAGAITIGAALLQWGLAQLDEAFGGALLGMMFAPLLAWRSLKQTAASAAAADEGTATASVPAGGLVDPDLQAHHEAAIGALIAGASSAVVAPVFWFVIAGLPGAALCRFADEAHLAWGRAVPWATKFDKVMSWVPVRITAWLFTVISGGRSPAEIAHSAKLREALRLAELCVAAMLAWSCLAIFLFAKDKPW